MPQLDAAKLKTRIKAFQISLFTLAALVETTEEELKDLIANKLEDERATALRREIEEVLRLGEDALVPDRKIPDERARKVAAKRVRSAHKALRGALESCRTGGGKAYCETIEHQLAGFDQLEQEFEVDADESAGTNDDN